MKRRQLFGVYPGAPHVWALNLDLAVGQYATVEGLSGLAGTNRLAGRCQVAVTRNGAPVRDATMPVRLLPLEALEVRWPSPVDYDLVSLVVDYEIHTLPQPSDDGGEDPEGAEDEGAAD